MRLRDLLSVGLLGLRTRKARAALSALGISIGIATLVLVTTIPASSRQALTEQLSALGSNVLEVSSPTQLNPPVPLPPESGTMVRRIAPVTEVRAVGKTKAQITRSDHSDPAEVTGVSVQASDLALLSVVRGHLGSGRFLDAATEHFPTVVLGAVAASRLGFPLLAKGSAPQVFIGGVWFTVVGVLDPMPLYPELERSALVGWDAARGYLGFDGHPSLLYVQAVDSAIEDVRSVLPGTVNPERPDAVQVTKPSEALAAKRATQTTFSALLLGLAAVALLVGGIGVANTMVISVLERRNEIGLRRALGATRGHIRGQFLTEAVALSGLGGALGLVLGVGAAAAYVLRQHWPLVVQPETLIGGLAGALLIGAFAGVYPSMRAARLTPTEALAL
ncbi:ABC transporter permease [Amycolatopsis sp. NBC_00345]|uniref:ABC transporter permease n=1 Tax=Amycolatopsis sp. NBC_00345 TaxID=2975955 RepID=UPI002E261CB9